MQELDRNWNHRLLLWDFPTGAVARRERARVGGQELRPGVHGAHARQHHHPQQGRGGYFISHTLGGFYQVKKYQTISPFSFGYLVLDASIKGKMWLLSNRPTWWKCKSLFSSLHPSLKVCLASARNNNGWEILRDPVFFPRTSFPTLPTHRVHGLQ